MNVETDNQNAGDISAGRILHSQFWTIVASHMTSVKSISLSEVKLQGFEAVRLVKTAFYCTNSYPFVQS